MFKRKIQERHPRHTSRGFRSLGFDRDRYTLDVRQRRSPVVAVRGSWPGFRRCCLAPVPHTVVNARGTTNSILLPLRKVPLILVIDHLSVDITHLEHLAAALGTMGDTARRIRVVSRRRSSVHASWPGFRCGFKPAPVPQTVVNALPKDADSILLPAEKSFWFWRLIGLV